jgi:hypothetical protein
MSWCDRCGDVGNICHDDTRGCHCHFCPQCNCGPTMIRDYMCEGCSDQQRAEHAEFYMLTARSEEERQRWSKRFAAFIGRGAA